MWLRGLDATIAGIPRGVLSQSAWSLLAHDAVMAALTLARKIKWRRCDCVTAFVVPAALMIGYGRESRVNMLICVTRSSSLKSLVIGSVFFGRSNAQSFFNLVVLISINPTFSSV